jgi:hypothetical protein
MLDLHPAPISPYVSPGERAGFEALLAGLGIAIRPGSVFEDVGRCLDEFLSLQDGGDAFPREYIRPRMQHIVAMVDLVRKLQRNRSHPSFDTLVPHLRLLDALDVDPSRSSKTAVRDQNSNKLFELLVAMVAMTFSRAVVLEGPREHAATSPDVVAEVDGVRWGFACKVLHSRDPRAYRARVAEGIRQLERAPVRAGLVVINLKNLVDSDVLTPYEPVLETERETTRHLAQVRSSIRSKIEEVGDLVADSFSRTKARPHVLHYLPGLAFAQAWALEFTGAAQPPDVAQVLDALNKGFQFG